MPDIMHLIKIHARPEQIYKALTTAEGVRNWWTRDADLDSEIGGTGEFRFYERRFIIRVGVQELRPMTHVGWKMISSGQPAFAGTAITFDLRAGADDTILAFVHRGFKQGDDAYAGATTRWGCYLLSMKQYLETGKGHPNPDDFAI